MSNQKQASLGQYIINTLNKTGLSISSDDNDKPLFCCRMPFQNNEFVKFIFLGALHYSFFYELDIIQRLCSNEKKILHSSKSNEDKSSLNSNFFSMFKEINSLINKKRISNVTFKKIPEAIHAEILTKMQIKEREPNLYDFLKVFSQLSSIDILLFENLSVKHFTIKKPIITIFLKLENSNLFLLYPESYSKEFITYICSNFKPPAFDILSCGHPFPNCVFKEGQNLTSYVLFYLQNPCQCKDMLFEEEKKNIIEACKNNNTYWKTNCAECSIELNSRGIKCQKCEFSYCMEQCCRKVLKKKDKYLCKICNTFLIRSRNKRKNSPKKGNEVKESKLYKDYDIPVKNSSRNCNHSSDIIFYCRECNEVSYQFDEAVIKNILCKGCELFFQNKNGHCSICIYKFHAEEEQKRQMIVTTDVVAGVDDIKNSEDISETGTEGNKNPLPN